MTKKMSVLNNLKLISLSTISCLVVFSCTNQSKQKETSTLQKKEIITHQKNVTKSMVLLGKLLLAGPGRFPIFYTQSTKTRYACNNRVSIIVLKKLTVL